MLLYLPVDLPSPPREFTVESVGAEEVSVSWRASSDDSNSPISAYHVIAKYEPGGLVDHCVIRGYYCACVAGYIYIYIYIYVCDTVCVCE